MAEENGAVAAPVTTEIVAPSGAENTSRQFIAGEVHIIADGRTGAISVNAPPNFVIALGLLEVAKNILVSDRNDKQRKIEEMQKRIIPAGAEALANLKKLQS